MNGKLDRYLLDTNAVVALLQGHTGLAQRLSNAEWVGISIITQLEFLTFPALSDNDAEYFRHFAQRVNVIGLTPYAKPSCRPSCEYDNNIGSNSPMPSSLPQH